MTKKNYNRKDHLHQKAKAEGYRSRAAYKLIELNDKYSLLKPGFKVLDLGAWPGGWMQVASEKIGPTGHIVGIDLAEIEPITAKNANFFLGNANAPEVWEAIDKLSLGKFQAILSDMAPKLTGIKEADRASAIGCAELALDIAKQRLESNGCLLLKLFKSPESDIFVKSFRTLFNKMLRTELDSSRNSSNEYYLIGFGYKGDQ